MLIFDSQCRDGFKIHEYLDPFALRVFPEGLAGYRGKQHIFFGATKFYVYAHAFARVITFTLRCGTARSPAYGLTRGLEQFARLGVAYHVFITFPEIELSRSLSGAGI
ncbi:hypothetical protein EVAR_41683_1 [Eumeta japonica]|uniref:Uncharacterized protein n=1 Tax=Eumeta variegata TaxID=151549 RepID=A0A4C1VPL8_EUMVA|nr:hypothetical protein EVAR_41683_1 [Eumeta japonica]